MQPWLTWHADLIQAQQQMTAQQARHEAQVLDLNHKAAQAANVTQQHVAQLSAQAADLTGLRQVSVLLLPCTLL